MIDRCPDEQELFAIAGRSGAEGLEPHLRACPRCRNRLHLYQEFLAGDPTVPSRDSADAQARLAAVLRDLARPVRAQTSHRSGPGLLGRVRALLLGPGLRPALAVAGLLVVVGGIAMWRESNRSPELLRGPGSSGSLFEVEKARQVDGGIELSWQAVEGADAYQVRLLSSELTEIRMLAPVPDTRIMIPADSLPESSDPEGLLAYRVIALRNGDPWAESRVGTFRRK